MVHEDENDPKKPKKQKDQKVKQKKNEMGEESPHGYLTVDPPSAALCHWTLVVAQRLFR